ncbi:type IV fimbrial biogenesis protein FimT [Pseudomonas pohangensis]|uniref:Type II secretion system protein H n=1 Tax=Pseudomonas pohangensis TaxID=364197 RepID=A0A1H2E4R2_9PSED|nr:GspH/FimT family pseudopilin [Pseudomonas pohangensis]SDT89678.1 type IV fimbrial biogenesis protein FimT [Pseudomonas pohangensis]
MNKVNGYTLLELTVCLGIVAIMLGVAVPNFESALARNKQTEATNLLIGALHYARGSAVYGRTVVSLCTGLSTCTDSQLWDQNILIFTDENKNGKLDNVEILLQQISTPTDLNWQWSNFRSTSYLQYEPDGSTRALNGTFTLCHAGQPLQQVVINLTGRVRTQKPGASARCR